MSTGLLLRIFGLTFSYLSIVVVVVTCVSRPGQVVTTGRLYVYTTVTVFFVTFSTFSLTTLPFPEEVHTDP